MIFTVPPEQWHHEKQKFTSTVKITQNLYEYTFITEWFLQMK